MSLTLTNRWRDAGRENKVDLIKAATLRPPVLWVTTEVLLHESTPAALEALEEAKTDRSIVVAPLSKACFCCGSRVCSVVERWPDLSIYIDRITGKRVKPERLTPEQRAKVEAAAEHVHIPIRVSRPQLPLLYSSDGRKDLISGGIRGGKSQVCAYAFTREWLLRGGKGANFWLVAHWSAYVLKKAPESSCAAQVGRGRMSVVRSVIFTWSSPHSQWWGLCGQR